MTKTPYYKNLTDKFDKLIKKENKSASLAGLQISAITIFLLTLFFVLLESFANFSSGVRTFFFFFLILISLGAIIYFFAIPYFRSIKYFHKQNDYFSTAKRIGNYFPAIKDDLLNAFQLVSVSGANDYSQNLTDAAFQRVYQKTEPIDFSDAVNFHRAKNLFKYTAVTFLAVFLLIFFIPSLNSAAMRIVNFDKEFIPSAKFTFEIFPGNSKVTKGENINFKIKVFGKEPNSVRIAVKNIEQTDFEFKDLLKDSLGVYNFTIPATRSSFEYFAVAENIQSENYKIEVIDKPIIRTLDVVVNQPSYSGLSQIILQNNGNFTALRGSKADFKISATKELQNAKLLFSDSTEFPLKINGRFAGGEFQILKEIDYEIILTDKENNLNENPVQYSIKVLNDEDPAIELFEPQESVSLGLDNRVQYLAKISDDFGFSKLLLKYQIHEEKSGEISEERSINISVSKKLKEESIDYVWNLISLQIKETEFVTSYLEIFDNDFISGPKSAKSKTVTIKIPSLNDIFAEADKMQRDSENKLSETLKDAEELRRDLEKISQDLKKNTKDITWQEKEKVEKAIQKYEDILNKTEEAQKDLSEMQNEMQKNDLLSKETMEKYQELQDLFKELSSEDMRKAMEKLKQSLENMNRNQVQKATEEFKFNEEQFKKSIERTLNLLKRAAIEQKFDEVTKRTEDLSKELNELKNETNKSDLKNQDQKENLAEKQNEKSDEIKNLEKSLEQLKDKMSEFKDLPNDQMEKSVEEFEQQKNEETSRQTEQQIMQGEKQKATQNQNKLSQNMEQMQKQMDQMQQQMQQQNQMQTFNEMRKVLSDLLTLSKEQEQLRNETQRMDQSSESFSKNAQKQQSLQNNMDKILNQLNELAKKTFAISPEMGQSLGKAQREMQQSTRHFQNRSSGQSYSSQAQAMAGLNEAALQLKTSMENMMNGGGSGSGMMSLMQQLQQLSQQQMNLNNMTQQMQQGNLSPQQQAEMQRLAQQQELIRKSLDELNKESKMAGESKKIPANLENIVKEMREVVSDLQSQQIDNELIQKQERILSRMIDAQRSINDRDFEKRRESNTGENIARQSPADLNLSEEKKRDRLLDELQKAVQEGYAKDYEELIRKYYEALQSQKLKDEKIQR